MTEEELEREVAMLAERRTWCITKSKWFRPSTGTVETGFQISIWKLFPSDEIWQTHFAGYDITAEQALEQIMDMVTAPDPAKEEKESMEFHVEHRDPHEGEDEPADIESSPRG